MLRRGFSGEVANACRAAIAERLGISDVAPVHAAQEELDAIAARLSAAGIPARTWAQPMVHIQSSFTDGPFAHIMNPHLEGALHELMGAGRATIHRHSGWWPVLFPGFPGPGGWHVDGNDFHHHLTSPEQGLVTLFLFSDVAPGDGGTPVVRGSHHTIARLVAEAEPAGLSPAQIEASLPPVDLADVVALTGEAGDVALMHPFVIHGFGPNRGTRVRFACNPRYQLTAPMQLARPDGAYSPVEAAIRRALPEVS
jgi:uncharacterized protein (DUF433 family)